jgi:hypothetical protein
MMRNDNKIVLLDTIAKTRNVNTPTSRKPLRKKTNKLIVRPVNKNDNEIKDGKK